MDKELMKPVAWCELTKSGKIGYFDGKPMIMVGDVGNDCHKTPLFICQPLPRDVLMTFGAAVMAATKESLKEHGSAFKYNAWEEVDLAAIADRYAGKVQPDANCKFPLCQNEQYQKEMAKSLHRELYVGQPEPVSQQMLAVARSILVPDMIDLLPPEYVAKVQSAIAAAEAAQTVVQDERAAFEKWFRREGSMPDFVGFDQTAPWAEFAFKAWSARTAHQPASAQPVAVPAIEKDGK